MNAYSQCTICYGSGSQPCVPSIGIVQWIERVFSTCTTLSISYIRPICKEIWVSLSQALNLADFSAFSPPHINCRKHCQLSSTTTSLLHWVTTWFTTVMQSTAQFTCDPFAEEPWHSNSSEYIPVCWMLSELESVAVKSACNSYAGSTRESMQMRFDLDLWPFDLKVSKGCWGSHGL